MRKEYRANARSAPWVVPLKGRNGVQDAGMEIVRRGAIVVAVVEATRVDLEGRRGTRFQQTKAATLPIGYLLALCEYRRDSYRACVLRERVVYSVRLIRFFLNFTHIVFCNSFECS